VGWLNNVLYVEAHPDLEGEETTLDQRFAVALRLIEKANNQQVTDFDQQALNKALKEQSGDPVAIYERLPPLDEASASMPEQSQTAAPAPATPPTPKPVRKPSPDGYYHGK
ncbi:MAG: hypothetical protein Q8R54_00275, partial [Methylobacter sp.]|nr:hypothetical protein [Methylobacter sp.]